MSILPPIPTSTAWIMSPACFPISPFARILGMHRCLGGECPETLGGEIGSSTTSLQAASKCNKNIKRWWFQTCCIYTPICGTDSIWRICFFRVVCNQELFMMSWLVYSWWRHAFWGSESTCFMMNDWWSHLLEDYFLFDGIWRLNASHGEQPCTHWTWAINQDKTVVSF